MVALVFQNNESAYLKWLSSNPAGFVINTYSEPSNDYLILHSAKCKAIGKARTGAHAECFTGNGYIRICADDIQELRDWVTEHGFDEFTKNCELCHPVGHTSYRRFNWTRDELILALDLYHSSPGARGNAKNAGVVELSELLQELPIHSPDLRPPNFRNANGVAMKLGNFLAYDPDYRGAGLLQGAQLEQDLWNEFAEDQAQLKQIALAIRENYPIVKHAEMQILNDEGVEEGGILLVLHKHYERDKSIICRKKKEVFEKNMALRCEVCDFDFARIYGDLGSQFCECHHTKPVATMKHGEKTKLSDLSIVCANCHRMLHRTRDVLSIETLKAILAKELALESMKNTFK